MRCKDLLINKLCANCSQDKPLNSGYCYVEDWYKLFPYLFDSAVKPGEDYSNWLKHLILANKQSPKSLGSLFIMLENFYPDYYKRVEKWTVLL